MHPISRSLRAQLDPGITFTEIFNSPDSCVGKKVILGGTIVAVRNFQGISEVEVVQKKLDIAGYPFSGDVSGGRFLFRYSGYLESEIYANGRRLTGAGTVVGSKTAKVGEVDYRFPVIEAEELHLWPDPDPYYYAPYYWGGYWSPYYPGYRRWGGYPFYP